MKDKAELIISPDSKALWFLVATVKRVAREVLTSLRDHHLPDLMYGLTTSAPDGNVKVQIL